MKKQTYPTLKQLTDGVVIPCGRGAHPSLVEIDASHVHLWLIEGAEEDGEELEDDPEAELTAALVVHVRLPGRSRWYWAGHFPGELDCPWDRADEDLLEAYLIDLINERKLWDQLEDWDEEEDDEDDDEEWEDDDEDDDDEDGDDWDEDDDDDGG